MDDSIVRSEDAAVLTEIPRYAPYPPPPPEPARLRRGIPALNLVLFLLTLLTTTMGGAYMVGFNISIRHPIADLGALSSGLSFSVPLMLILLAHEMGHYVTARRNRVDTSLPYFIPAPLPFFIGTFGAFIRIRSMPPSRRVMFDIGAAGPWAGVILAIPAVILGLALSRVGPLDQAAGGLQLGNSLLFFGLARWVLHVDPNAVNIDLNPIAFAGWLGLFVTTLNLLPVGQLDGGHVIYALFGRRHRIISHAFVAACFLMVIVPLILGRSFWLGWAFWAVLLIAFGLGHPATTDVDTPLDPRRRLAAWLTVVLFVVTFSPVPFYWTAPSGAPPEQQERENYYNVQAAPGPARAASVAARDLGGAVARSSAEANRG